MCVTEVMIVFKCFEVHNAANCVGATFVDRDWQGLRETDRD
jgi:hypothetical protein